MSICENENCDNEFTPIDRHLICRSCRYKAKKLPCINCGELRHPNNKYEMCQKCLIIKRETKYGRTEEGNRIDKDGYVKVRVPINHSRSETVMAEHILIMEKFLGRELIRPETVHHKNGNRSDNRLSNLELWSFSQPKGQRVIDKLVWAKEILDLYGDYHG